MQSMAGYQGLQLHPSVCLYLPLHSFAFDLSEVLLSPAIIFPFIFFFPDSFSKQTVLDLLCIEMLYPAQCGEKCESAAFGNPASQRQGTVFPWTFCSSSTPVPAYVRK